jgi:L-cysteine desulfidase
MDAVITRQIAGSRVTLSRRQSDKVAAAKERVSVHEVSGEAILARVSRRALETILHFIASIDFSIVRGVLSHLRLRGIYALLLRKKETDNWGPSRDDRRSGCFGVVMRLSGSGEYVDALLCLMVSRGAICDLG